MKVFLDDVRIPIDCIKYMYHRIGNLNPIYDTTIVKDWTVVKNYDQFKLIIEAAFDANIKITHISFDHDLADFHYEYSSDDYDNMSDDEKEKTFGSMEKDGYDCAKWLKQFYLDNKIELPIMFVHSMNPVGTEKIIKLFK